MVFQNASTCVRGYETNGFEQLLSPNLFIGLEHLMVSIKRLDTYHGTYLQSQYKCLGLGITREEVQTGSTQYSIRKSKTVRG